MILQGFFMIFLASFLFFYFRHLLPIVKKVSNLLNIRTKAIQSAFPELRSKKELKNQQVTLIKTLITNDKRLTHYRKRILLLQACLAVGLGISAGLFIVNFLTRNHFVTTSIPIMILAFLILPVKLLIHYLSLFIKQQKLAQQNYLLANPTNELKIVEITEEFQTSLNLLYPSIQKILTATFLLVLTIGVYFYLYP